MRRQDRALSVSIFHVLRAKHKRKPLRQVMFARPKAEGRRATQPQGLREAPEALKPDLSRVTEGI